MSATRIKNNGSGNFGGGVPLSNKAPKRKGGSPIPILLLLALIGAGGYFGWKEFDKRSKARRAREAEYYRQLAEKEAREKAEAEALAKANEKKSDRKVVAEVVEKKASVKPQKSAMEIYTAREEVRKEVMAKIAEARKKQPAKPLNGFAGIRFDEPIKDGTAVRWGTVKTDDAGESVSTRGASFAVYGPKLKKPFMTLGSQPLVWVTPKSRKPYRIEFSRPIRTIKPGQASAALDPRMAAGGGGTDGSIHDSDTTNLVAFLTKRFECEPFVPLPIEPEVKGAEFVYVMGDGTVRVAEDGDMLIFSVEREDVRAEAFAESEAIRAAERRVSESDAKALDSKRYPRLPIDRNAYRGVKLKDETPRTFCGIVFASRPPESATVQIPMKGPKGFFLDYEMAKCPAFRGFTRGRADLDDKRGGVYAVTLFSAGGTGGLDDKDYYESVKAALAGHYKVQPKEKNAGSSLPQLIYQVGDLTITFGPDVRGGFMMRAENRVLAEMAQEKN